MDTYFCFVEFNFCTWEVALDNLSLELVRERLSSHHRTLETLTETGLASVIALRSLVLVAFT